MAKMEGGGFIAWLARQGGRTDGVGDLSRTVKADRRPGRMASCEDLSKRLNQDEAPWEFHDALEQAEGEFRQQAGL